MVWCCLLLVFCCILVVFLFFLQIVILICKSKILILFLCSDCVLITWWSAHFFVVGCSVVFLLMINN